MSPPPAKTPAPKRSLGIYNRLHTALGGNRYWFHEHFKSRIWRFVVKRYPKSVTKDARRNPSAYTFSDAIGSDLEDIADDFLKEVLSDLVAKADWSDLHTIVFDEREAQKKKVAELASAVDTLTKSNEEAVARAVAAEGLVAKLGADLRREQQNARQAQTELETKAAELAAERDGLRAALDEAKGELAQMRETLHAESGALRTIAKELGYNDQEIAKHEAEGKLVAVIQSVIQSLVEADEKMEEHLMRQDALYDALQESGLYPANADPTTWRDDLGFDQQNAFFIHIAERLVEVWVKHRPEREAVRALTAEQKQLLVDDQEHLARKLRPLHPLRANLLRALGPIPDDFVESGALGYRDVFDRRLVGDALDWGRFDQFVQMVPRLRMNSRIDSWSKLSREAHTHKNTLRRYADFVDLSRWLPKAEEPSHNEDRADG